MSEKDSKTQNIISGTNKWDYVKSKCSWKSEMDQWVKELDAKPDDLNGTHMVQGKN